MICVDREQFSTQLRRFCSHFWLNLGRENRNKDVNSPLILTGCSHFPRGHFPLTARVRRRPNVNKMLTEKKDPHINTSGAAKTAPPVSKGFQQNPHLLGFGFWPYPGAPR